MTSPGNVWAVGWTFTGQVNQTLILHWDGRSWKRVPSPDPGGSQHDNLLHAVAVTSSASAWAVGEFIGKSDRAMILHWNGIRWANVASPNPLPDNHLLAVAASSSTSAWAVGASINGNFAQALAIRCC
jgi:hypothetical protein